MAERSRLAGKGELVLLASSLKSQDHPADPRRGCRRWTFHDASNSFDPRRTLEGQAIASTTINKSSVSGVKVSGRSHVHDSKSQRGPCEHAAGHGPWPMELETMALAVSRADSALIIDP